MCLFIFQETSSSSHPKIQGMKIQLYSSFWISVTFLIAINSNFVTGLGKKGDPCIRDTDCEQDSFISCNRNLRKCDCPPSLLLFYSLEAKCVSYVDGICTYTKSKDLPAINCVDNAICIKGHDPTGVDGKCVCKTGYYRTKANHCAKNLPISVGGGGGIETPRSKNSGSSRYPEPYHSLSTASSFKGVLYLIVSLILIVFTFKMFDVI